MTGSAFVVEAFIRVRGRRGNGGGTMATTVLSPNVACGDGGTLPDLSRMTARSQSLAPLILQTDNGGGNRGNNGDGGVRASPG